MSNSDREEEKSEERAKAGAIREVAWPLSELKISSWFCMCTLSSLFEDLKLQGGLAEHHPSQRGSCLF